MTQPGPRYGSMGEGDAPSCPKHPDRPAYAVCGRCGRPVCTDCAVSAPVGVRCRDCVKQDAASARPARTVFGGEYRPQARPLVTYVLIGLCVLLWMGQWVSDAVTNDLLFVPYLGLAEPWRFLAACFVHMPRNPTHVGMNMLALWMVGRVLEPMLGWARYLALYLISGLAGSVAMVLSALVAWQGGNVDPWISGSLGASGAVFGLFGAYFVAARRLGADSSGIIGLLVINAAFTFIFPNVAWEAHLGGLVVGGLVMLLLSLTSRPSRHSLQWPMLLGWVALLVGVTVLAYVAGSAPYLR